MHVSDCVKSMGLKVPFGLAETGKLALYDPIP